MFNLKSGDPNIMLSIINMKLRDEFTNLDSLVKYYSINKNEIINKLKDNGFQYNEKENQFKRI